jgi:hypothetical protein
MHCIWGFIRALFGGRWVWLTAIIASLLGVGFFREEEYAAVRDQIANWVGYPVMPETLHWWWVAFVFLIWVSGRLAYQETMRYCRGARVIFDEPYVHRNITLWGGPDDARQPVTHFDLAKIDVRNVPYDGASGVSVEDAFGRLEVYNPASRECVLVFDYPRWQENPKPDPSVYSGRYVDDWNRRLLRASGENNTLNFLIKGIEDECAYGFRGTSQYELWRDEDLKLASGDYVAKLTVSGIKLRKPAEKWFAISVGGAGHSIDIGRAKPLNLSRWP